MKKFIILILVSLILLTSCNIENLGPDPSSTIGPTRKPNDDPIYGDEVEPLEGGSLSLGVSSFNSLHPLYTDNEDIKNYMSLVYESLFSLDGLLNIKESLARSGQTTDGGMTWIIELADDIKWHDGDFLNADDCIYTIELILEGGSLYSSIANNIDKLIKLSDLSFEIYLKEPDLYLPYKLTFPIIKVNSNNLSRIPNGSGMYKFSAWEGKEIKLIRNNDYRGKAPYIDELIIKIYENERLKFESDSDIFLLHNDNVSKYLNKGSYRAYKYIGRGYTYIMPNLKISKNIRQAIQYIIDKDNIINLAISGNGVQAKWPILPGTSFSQLTDGKSEKSFDKAKEYLEKESYYQKEDGKWYRNSDIERKSPLTLSCNILSSSQEMRQVALAIKDQLEAFGIIFNISYQSESDYREAIRNSTYNLTVMKIDISSLPNFLDLFSSSGPLNLNSYSNPNLDSYIANIYQYEDIGQKIYEIENILNEDLPLIGLYLSKEAIVVSEKVLGKERKYSFYNLFDDFAEFHLYTKGLAKGE